MTEEGVKMPAGDSNPQHLSPNHPRSGKLTSEAPGIPEGILTTESVNVTNCWFYGAKVWAGFLRSHSNPKKPL